MNKSQFKTFGARRVAASLVAAASLLLNVLLAMAVTASGGQGAKSQGQRLGEEQRVVHVLNRLAFGPRPGDVERVRRIGVERYIEEQLNPQRIDDAAAEARLKDLTTLTMSNSELLAKYPNPGQLIRRLQRSGDLPADLAPLVAARKGVGPQTDATPTAKSQAGDASAMQSESGVMKDEQPAPADPDRAEYRRAVRAYMREHGMEPPARITAELQASRILRAVYSERQLQEVMVDFWSNHFNVFAGKGADRWFLTSYDRDVIRPHALGNFRDLLGATAKSPAMLFYLDNFQSVSPQANARGGRGGLRALLGAGNARANRDPETRRPAEQQQRRARRGINENYARELMELHTLGVDGGYTQRDVQEIARAFTGWTIIAPRGGGERAQEMLGGLAGTFVFVPRLHDSGEKTVLGQKIPAGGGIEDGQRVLDILVRHPSTARFIATKLARRFVMDEPSPALVNRVAAAFTKSNGDIKETLRALFSSPEFNSAEARRAKIKTPFELAVSSLRALGAETNGGPALHQWVARMGEGLYQYQAPTGYPDKAENWVSTGGLLERLNFALALVGNRIPGTRVDLARFLGDDARAGADVDRRRVADQLVAVILQGDISDRSRAALLKQLSEQSSPATSATQEETRQTADAMDAPRGGRFGRRARGAAQNDLASVANPEVARIAALVLGSPEFQRQ